jgi:formylglycine-generating enzyme required for sulfatase activity
MLEKGSRDINGGCEKKRLWDISSEPVEINGTFDMAGNFWEWVADHYGKYPEQKSCNPLKWVTDRLGKFQGEIIRNPTGLKKGRLYVIRSGSWLEGASKLRGTQRSFYIPGGAAAGTGFRCATSIND